MSSYKFKSNRSGINKTLRPRKKKKKGSTVSNVLISLTEHKIITQSSHHFICQNLNATTYSDTGIYIGGWTCSNLITQGTANNQRIGNTVKLLYIDYYFNVYAPPAFPDTVRVIVIKQSGVMGYTPTLPNMFDDPANNLSCVSPNAMKTYRIIADEYVDVGGVYQTKQHNFHIPLHCNTTYFTSGPGLADVENYAIYVMAISVNGTNNSQVLQFWSTLHFVDF